MFKKIKTNFIYNFNISDSDLYIIEIEATCASGKILGLWGGEDLRVEIDKQAWRELPESKYAQYFNIAPAWSGSELNGKIKTVFFIVYLEKGEHELNFIPKSGAEIAKEPLIKKYNSLNSIVKDKQAEESNRKPWITIVLVDLPLNILDVSATCGKRKGDSDDLKLIIDGKIEKNQESNWWGRNWFFQGRFMKGGKKEVRFYPKLQKGIHYIEFWADRMPVLNEVRLDLKSEQQPPIQIVINNIKTYNYQGINKSEDYNRYDENIIKWTNYWNEEFLNDKFPVQVPLDPSLVKAIVYQESKMGYFPGGEIDIMQVGNEGDPAIKTMNGELEEWWMQNGKIVRLDYEGDANVNSIDQSLKWGIRWLYHKAQGIKDNQRYWRDWKKAVFKYGPNTDAYIENIWNIYKQGIDRNNKTSIKLWTIIVLLLAGFSYFVHYNQGQVYFNFFDRGEKHTCLGRLMLKVGILDGLRIKNAVIGPINDKELGSYGMKKETISVDTIYDFDNDGKSDILISAEHAMGSEIKYFFRLGDKGLEPIRIINNHHTQLVDDNSLFALEIFFGQKDKQGRYTFVTKETANYDNGDQRIFRSYYQFNDSGDIEFVKKDIEEKIAMNKPEIKSDK